MATFNKYQDFVEQLIRGVHDFDAHTFKLALFTATHTPSAGDTSYSSLTNEVANGNGYVTGGATLTITVNEATGVATVDSSVDASWTGTGAGFSYRYAVLYNDTAAGKNLVCYWDEGVTVTVGVGETRTLQFNASGIFTLT